MNSVGHSFRAGTRLAATIWLFFVPGIAWPQGEPDIIWAGGGHSSYVNSVAYSPDGQLLISGSNDRTIKLWQNNGVFIKSLAIPYDINNQLTDVTSVAVSPDGTLLAVGVEQYHAISQNHFGALQLWRIPDGSLIHTFTGYGAKVTSTAFSPSGEFLASGSNDRSVKVWRLADQSLVSDRFDHSQEVRAVAFSSDGQWLASGSDDHTAILYQTFDWTPIRTLTGHSDAIESVAFSPNSTRLATGSLDQTVRIWNVGDGGLFFTMMHGSPVYSVAFAPDDGRVASGAFDKTIKLWNPVKGTLIYTLFGQAGTVLSLAFSPDSRTLASGSWYPGFAIRLWGDPQGARLPFVTFHSGPIKDLIITPDHQLISAADTTLRFWNESVGRPRRTFVADTNVNALAVSPNGQLLAMPGPNHTVSVRRISDGMLIQTLVGHTDDITGLAFSHNGQLLASGAFFNGVNDRIKLWSVSNWSVVRELSGDFIFGPFVSMNFSPDDAFLTASCEGAPAVWRVADGALVRLFSLVGLVLRFSPDGLFLAIGSDPVRIFRTSDWMEVATLSDQNQAMAFTPDGQHLALAGQSQIQFWRVADWGMQLFYDQELGYTGNGVTALAFSPDGTRFVYGRMDAVVAMAANPVSSHFHPKTPPKIGDVRKHVPPSATSSSVLAPTNALADYDHEHD